MGRGIDLGPNTQYRLVCTVAALAAHDDPTAELERHRRANLVRAVTQGVDPEWVSDIVAAEGFDAVPWRVAEGMAARLAAAEALLRPYASEDRIIAAFLAGGDPT